MGNPRELLERVRFCREKMKMNQRADLLSVSWLAAFVLLALMGCGTDILSNNSNITISIAVGVDEPVEGGLLVQTKSLGKTHLSKPLLSAIYGEDTEINFFDITFSDLSPKPFLYIPARLFLNRDRVSGMAPEEIIEKLNSAELLPGNLIYLIVDSSKNRIIHQLTTTREKDSTVFVHSELGEDGWGMTGSKFEVRQILKENDPDGTAMKTTSDSNKEVYWVSPPQFIISKKTTSSGIPWRCQLTNDLESAAGAKVSPSDQPGKRLTQEELNDWNGEPVILTGLDSEGMNQTTKALFWSSLPGLQIKIDTPAKLNEIKSDFRQFRQGWSRHWNWHTIDYSESGVSSHGGTL